MFPLFALGLSLACKFAPVALYEQEDDDQGYDVCYVWSYPLREFRSFSAVGLCQEFIPSPAVTCSTEEYVYEAS